MTVMTLAFALISVPLFCFAAATVIEVRRDRGSLRSLIRMLPIAIGAVASILWLVLLQTIVDPSNLLWNAMSVLALLVAVCGFLCRYKSRFAAVLVVVGGLSLAFIWLISRLRA